MGSLVCELDQAGTPVVVASLSLALLWCYLLRGSLVYSVDADIVVGKIYAHG